MADTIVVKERFIPKFKQMVAYYYGIEDMWISQEREQDYTKPDNELIPAGHMVMLMADQSIKDGGLVSELEYAMHHKYGEDEEVAWVRDEGEWLRDVHALTRPNLSNGVLVLNDDALVPSELLPSYVDDVIEGYAGTMGGPPDYAVSEFWKNEAKTIPLDHPREKDKIYVDIPTHKIYRWSGNIYVLISRATDVLNDSIVKGTVYDKEFTWTVFKLMTAFKSYNPEFFESVSMGRKEGSAVGVNSTALGTGVIAAGANQLVTGKYNVQDATSLEIVGKGTDDTHRANARTLDAAGNEWLAGNLSVSGATSITGDIIASSDVSVANNLAVTGTINGKKFSSVIPYHEYVTDNDVPTNMAVETYIVSWFDYVQIAISSLAVKATSVSPSSPTAANDGSLVEKGSTVTQVQLSYQLNKDATAMKLDGTATTNDSGNTDYKDTITRTVSLNNTNKTWTFYVEDTRPDGSHKSASKNVTLSFVNRVFYGAAAIPSTINSSFVRGLSNSVLDADGIVSGISITTGANQYMWYCSTNNKCKFNVGGFDGGFEPAVSVSVKDAGNTDTTYYVYRSTNPNLGTKTVTVK